ncbi:hypothetical protein Tco_0450904 [Tanacetum coccineum]
MPRECLKIIESKSKVRQSRNKAVVAKMSTSSSTQAVSSDVAELKDMVRALILDRKNQTPASPPNAAAAANFNKANLVIDLNGPQFRFDLLGFLPFKILMQNRKGDWGGWGEGEGRETSGREGNGEGGEEGGRGGGEEGEGREGKGGGEGEEGGGRGKELGGNVNGAGGGGRREGGRNGRIGRKRELQAGPNGGGEEKERNGRWGGGMRGGWRGGEDGGGRGGGGGGGNNFKPGHTVCQKRLKAMSQPMDCSVVRTLQNQGQKPASPNGNLTDAFKNLLLLIKALTSGSGTLLGKFYLFPADFVVVDFEPDPRVPLILGRCFLKTSHALIDVYEGEITLRVGKEAITFNLDQTSKYTADYNHMTVNKIDVIDMACA